MFRRLILQGFGELVKESNCRGSNFLFSESACNSKASSDRTVKSFENSKSVPCEKGFRIHHEKDAPFAPKSGTKTLGASPQFGVKLAPPVGVVSQQDDSTWCFVRKSRQKLGCVFYIGGTADKLHKQRPRPEHSCSVDTKSEMKCLALKKYLGWVGGKNTYLFSPPCMTQAYGNFIFHFENCNTLQRMALCHRFHTTPIWTLRTKAQNNLPFALQKADNMQQ